jgi:hypothetical protein
VLGTGCVGSCHEYASDRSYNGAAMSLWGDMRHGR